MKILLVIAVAFIFISCNQEEEVGWHEPGALYKGIRKSGLPTQVFCCEDGNNCAKRQIVDYPPSQSRFTQYVNDNNIKGYFEQENWQSMFPELVERPDIIAQIIQVNPIVRFMDNYLGNKSIVIFKTDDPSKNDTEDILFVVDNMSKMDKPCPDAQ